MNRKGFSIVDLLVGIVVGSILLLMIGVMSNLGLESNEVTRREAEVYNELQSAINLMEYSIRRAQAVSIVDWTNPPWISRVLLADHGIEHRAFGLSQIDAAHPIQLIYSPDSLTFTNVLFEAQNLNLTFTQSGNLITFTLSGSKNGVNFNLTSNALARN